MKTQPANPCPYCLYQKSKDNPRGKHPLNYWCSERTLAEYDEMIRQIVYKFSGAYKIDVGLREDLIQEVRIYACCLSPQSYRNNIAGMQTVIRSKTIKSLQKMFPGQMAITGKKVQGSIEAGSSTLIFTHGAAKFTSGDAGCRVIIKERDAAGNIHTILETRATIREGKNLFLTDISPVAVKDAIVMWYAGKQELFVGDLKEPDEDGEIKFPEPMDREMDVEAIVSAKIDAEKAISFLDDLPGTEKAVICLHFGLDGCKVYSINTIAKRLGHDSRWVQARLDRGITRLQQLMSIS